MAESVEFPPVNMVEVEVQTSARWSAMREVSPLVDRVPYGDWCRIFYQHCEDSSDLDWKGAGFVLCEGDEIERVRTRLGEITAVTNARFANLLGTAEPRATAEELLELESINAASVDGQLYRVVWPG